MQDTLKVNNHIYSIVTALKNARSSQDIYEALYLVPNYNLEHMRNMINDILNNERSQEFLEFLEKLNIIPENQE